MAASSLSLTVRSVNDVIITTETRPFITERITELKANANPATTMSVTEAGDTGSQLATWKIYGTGEKLYWQLTAAGAGHQVALFKGQNGLLKVAQGSIAGNGLIILDPVNQSGISGEVTLTWSAADADNSNTVQCTTFTDSTDPELPGSTQFMYDMGNGYIVKFTVDETVTAINTAIAGDNQFLDSVTSLTTAQITLLNSAPVALITAPGSGYAIEIISAFINYDRATADITGNLTPALVTTTTGTVLWNATNAFQPSADTITRFLPVAGVLDSNEGISIKMHTGDPTMGASTGAAKVVVTYKITAV